MNNELISIVIPAYNVEQYIAKCLDSIITQTYSNIEIQIINDGSIDNTGSICDSYAERDPRINVFHIDNGGVGKARQFGVLNSTGNYILFVDPDDWMEIDGVEKLFEAMDPDIDIVRSSFNYYIEPTKIFKPRILADKTYIGSEYLKGLFTKLFPNAPWGNLYRKKLFTDDSFPNTRRTQDLLMNVNLACKCSKMKSISTITYNYRFDSDTSSKYSHSYDYKFRYNLCKIMYDTINRYGYYEAVKREFATKAIDVIYINIIKIDTPVHNDPLIAEILRTKREDNPSLKMRLIIFLIEHPFVRTIIGALNRVRKRMLHRE